MGKKPYNLEDSPAMQFVRDSPILNNFAEITSDEAMAEFDKQRAEESPNTEIKPQEPDSEVFKEKDNTNTELVFSKRGERRTRAVNMRLPESFYSRIKERASQKDVSITEYIIKAVTLVMDKYD